MPSRTLQEARREYTAREISRAAIRLFAERGFDTVTVDEIAAAVGMSSRTFFRYFGSKEEVVLRYQRRIQERLIEALEARPPTEGPVTALRNAYVVTSYVAPTDRGEWAMIGRFLEESRTLLALSRGEHAADEALTTALASRLGVDSRRDPLAETVAAATGAAASAAFHRWVASGGRGDPSARVAAALDILAQGLNAYDHSPSRTGEPI